MDDLIFKLERVVQTKGSEPLEDFEGPLDLILFLLSKNKIEIQDIPIALILDQYLAYGCPPDVYQDPHAAESGG